MKKTANLYDDDILYNRRINLFYKLDIKMKILINALFKKIVFENECKYKYASSLQNILHFLLNHLSLYYILYVLLYNYHIHSGNKCIYLSV
jgi:hypothetical protein